MRLSFSADKISKVAIQEHKVRQFIKWHSDEKSDSNIYHLPYVQHLLRILLMYELESSKVAPFWWAGKFSTQGEAVIAQHSAQSGLTSNDCALAQWSAFTTVHSSHSLAFKLFETLLEKLVRHIRMAELTSDEVKMFWEGIRKLLPSCFSIIRNIRKRTAGDKNSLKILNEVVSIISIVSKLTPPAEFDLFPRNIYGYVLPVWPFCCRLIEMTIQFINLDNLLVSVG